jgi:hypothetical protein
VVERRTFIVRVHAHDAPPTVEDVATGERVRLPNLAAIVSEIERRLAEPAADARARDDERP